MNLDDYPFYKKARKAWNDTQTQQIIKGLHKYVEPFNPHSWTPEELLSHGIQENVDQLHYLVGLFDLIKAIKSEKEQLEIENERLREEAALLRQTFLTKEEWFQSLPRVTSKPVYFDLDD